jgi:hypothetical protein
VTKLSKVNIKTKSKDIALSGEAMNFWVGAQILFK